SLVDPSVAIELDLYWALVGGQDVVALVKELGDRLVAIHVKDGIKPESNPFAPGAPKFASTSLDQRHAGEGEVPTVEAMKAATGVKYAVIEYDNAPGDVFEDIENSYRFLIDGGLAA
ncbi:MAG: sugar phosphate isomerase/epimerase family protein, partial [Brachybacterium sp.]